MRSSVSKSLTLVVRPRDAELRSARKLPAHPLEHGAPAALAKGGASMLRPRFLTPLLIVVLAPSAHALNLVRSETRTDDAVSTFGVDGSGVTIAILDRGIDWTHPDFIKADGTTRIRAMLDMSGQNLCDPGNPPPIEYTEAQINAALAGGPTVAERDAVGHSTSTAGTAAGNGRALPDLHYRGIATGADLVIV